MPTKKIMMTNILSLTNLHYSLTYLSLAGNKLARFPPMFQQSFPRLETLDLSNNQLTAVPNSLMRQTPRLAKFLIDNNQLVTLMLEVNTEHSIYFRKFLQPSSIVEVLLKMIH